MTIPMKVFMFQGGAALGGVSMAIVGTVTGIVVWDKINRITDLAEKTTARISCLEAAVSDDDIFDSVRAIADVVSYP